MVVIVLDDTPRMIAIERAVAALIDRINTEDAIEPGLVACALTRLTRELLEKYPPTLQDQLTNVCCAFLRHAEPVEDDASVTLN